jgi:hypothetical protein
VLLRQDERLVADVVQGDRGRVGGGVGIQERQQQVLGGDEPLGEVRVRDRPVKQAEVDAPVVNSPQQRVRPLAATTSSCRPR